MEPVGYDARQVDILHESHLVNRLMRTGLRLSRAECKISEDARKVWLKFALYEIRIDLWVEVLHVQQIDYVDRRLWLLLEQLLLGGGGGGYLEALGSLEGTCNVLLRARHLGCFYR